VVLGAAEVAAAVSVMVSFIDQTSTKGEEEGEGRRYAKMWGVGVGASPRFLSCRKGWICAPNLQSPIFNLQSSRVCFHSSFNSLSLFLNAVAWMAKRKAL
jgi:hypothetical protein